MILMRSNLDLVTLVAAYSQGYFPMPHPKTDVIEWFRPDPRAILPLDNFHISRSLKRFISKTPYQTTINHNFTNVMNLFSQRPDTWINQEFIRAYSELHKHKFAHSVEIWFGEKLVGGLYGVCLGGA